MIHDQTDDSDPVLKDYWIPFKAVRTKLSMEGLSVKNICEKSCFCGQTSSDSPDVWTNCDREKLAKELESL
jgi:hypothetical protein